MMVSYIYMKDFLNQVDVESSRDLGFLEYKNVIGDFQKEVIRIKKMKLIYVNNGRGKLNRKLSFE